MNLYQNNAFRVLGLLTDVTTSQIVARANEIKVKKSVDLGAGYEYDFLWLGPIDRSEENITSAVQRLEDPVRRIKQELSWFWLQSEGDQKAVKALTKGEIQDAFAIWLKDSGLTVSHLYSKEIFPLTTPEALTALHNLFVLFQAILLRNELSKSEDQIIVLVENDPKSQENWAVALRVFNFLHANQKFWDLVKKRIDQMQDRRAQNVSMDEIRESALNNALSAHFFLMTRALGNKDLPMLDKHIEILENANMAVDLYKSGLNLVLNSRIESINFLCDEFVRERKVAEDKGDSALYKNLFYKYRDSGKSLIDDCKIIDRKGVTDFAISREKFAKSFHQLSWKLNKTGDALGALESMKEAYNNLYSDALKMECEKDAQKIMEDALEQYSNQATKLINPIGGKAPLDEILNIKQQYLGNVQSLFSSGEVFMDDKLQMLLRELVAKELKLISVEVHDKHQAYEHAQSILKEAMDWAVEAKDDALKQELETVKRDWMDGIENKVTKPRVIVEARRKPVLAWVVGLVLVIASIFSVRSAIELSSKTPVPPVTVTTQVSAPQEEPAGSLAQKGAVENVLSASNSSANVSSVVIKTAPAVIAVVPAVIPSQAQAQSARENPLPVAVEMPVSTQDQALLAQAAEVKSVIEANKEKIKAMETELDMRRRENEVRQASIDRLDNKIGSNPDSPEYNFWVNEHNDLVREQNQAIETAKQMYAEYQAEFKRQQDLIMSYNERFAR